MTGTGPTVKRTVFSTPRSGEFLELRALQAQTGQDSEDFGDVVVKELIDNALDAAETANRDPVIEISARTDDDIEVTFITVSDNGPGISAATVIELCDFSMLVSDKARYRGPTRGAQGNAFKTLLGIPYALGVSEPVVIESAGWRHEIRVAPHEVRGVDVTRQTTPSERTVGTSVTVPVPSDLYVDVERWALGAAFVNPHATITAINQDQFGSDSGDESETFYKYAGQGWSKWIPSMPSSPHWYSPRAFSMLVHSYIHMGVDKPLGQFISEFDGLSGSAKQSAVRKAIPGIAHLSQLEGNEDLIGNLHAAMLQHARPTPPKRLGPVGEDHLHLLLDAQYKVYRKWYKAIECVDGNGIPWLIEVIVADTEKRGRTWFACNHAPSFGDPLGRTVLMGNDFHAHHGAIPFLTSAGSVSNSAVNRAAVIHIICAAPQFVDKGKVALVVPESVAEVASKALDATTKTLRKEAELRLRDARRAEREQDRARKEAAKEARKDQWEIKKAVFEVMAEAKAAAGHICAARTLYYQVRPRIQQHTDKELTYKYFSQLLPEYQRDVQQLPGVYYEARGTLVHPHDGKVLRLGTREVEAYIPPHWQFDKILYIEKTGLEAQLAPYELGKKYDMAIIYGQGYAVTACRELLAMFNIRGVKIFVLHDADINGYDIARTLREATKRMPDHNIEVIDLGLTVPQALAERLETEEFTRKSELPADLLPELDDAAKVWFTGTALPSKAKGKGKVHYKGTRCELNAFSSDRLAAFIVEGLKHHLEKHGIPTKLVPPSDVLTEYAKGTRDKKIEKRVLEEIRAIFDVERIVSQVNTDNPNLTDNIIETKVREAFTTKPTLSWRSSADQLVDENVNAIPGLTETIHARLIEQLDESQDD